LNPIDPFVQPLAIPNDPSTTTGSSPYPSRPDSATYGRLELHPSAYSQRPPQPAAVYGMWSAHHVPRPCVSLLLSCLRRVASSCPFPRCSRNARPHRPPTCTASTLTTASLLVPSRLLLTNTAPKHALSIHGTSISSPPGVFTRAPFT
jgi:hypothetical protein